MKSQIKAKTRSCIVLLIALATLLLLVNIVTTAPPTPHNVGGRVFYSDGVSGVENGFPVLINDTTSNNSVLTQVYAPLIPTFKGSYAATINGNDGDTIIVRSWNSTNYGQTVSTLASSTTVVDVVLNLTRPSETNVTITDPQNNSVKEIATVFNITASISIIGGQNGVNCSAKINMSNEDILNLSSDTYEHNLEDISLGSSTTTTWTLISTDEGLSNISVIAYCDSDGINFENVNLFTIYNIAINDTNPPNITILEPINNTWNNTGNLSFYFNATDPSNIQSCALYLDDILQLTNDTVQSGSNSTLELFNVSEGNHSWFISCYDNSSYSNQQNSSKRYINVDLSVPVVNLMSPGNKSQRSNNTIVFDYNVTDSYGIIDNCTFILNGSVYDTKYGIQVNITQNFTFTLDAGYYSWQVLCFDKANNSDYSDTWFVNITNPDLAVYSAEITFSNDHPVEYEDVIVNATIYNIGNDNATNVVVRFYEDTPYDTQIGSDIILNLLKGESKTVNITWTPRIGSYNIYVVVDPPYETNGSIKELDETNNVGNRTIFIPAYSTYYGGITANIELVTLSNNSVFTWFNETNINGNIYIIDSDSSITWKSLFAIGTNTTNKTSTADFEEIDTALNMSHLKDSVNHSYTNNGASISYDSFLSYGTNLSGVPVVNSTNTSDFITGILWDSNDDNPGEYNGSQDLIFVTKINKNTQGGYGIYDYEIKVPANLKRYVTPDDDTTLTFYAELT